jgi:hypothetical protein
MRKGRQPKLEGFETGGERKHAFKGFVGGFCQSWSVLIKFFARTGTNNKPSSVRAPLVGVYVHQTVANPTAAPKSLAANSIPIFNAQQHVTT